MCWGWGTEGCGTVTRGLMRSLGQGTTSQGGRLWQGAWQGQGRRSVRWGVRGWNEGTAQVSVSLGTCLVAREVLPPGRPAH